MHYTASLNLSFYSHTDWRHIKQTSYVYVMLHTHFPQQVEYTTTVIGPGLPAVFWDLLWTFSSIQVAHKVKSRLSNMCLFIAKARCSKQYWFKPIHGLYKIFYQPGLQHKETMAMYLSRNQLFLSHLASQSSAVSNVPEVDSTPLGKFLPTVL